MEQVKRKTRLGRVISNKMEQTVVVMVQARRKHPRYGKIVTYRAKFKAHDEGNKCDVGDMVRVVESRPLSKQKRWRVTEIVNKAKAPGIKPGEVE